MQINYNLQTLNGASWNTIRNIIRDRSNNCSIYRKLCNKIHYATLSTHYSYVL